LTRQNQKQSDRSVSDDACIIRGAPIGKPPNFPGSRAEKKSQIQEDFMKTELTKKQKVTELFYNAKDPIAEIHTHDVKLKKRLLAFAEEYPELCKQTDNDGQGGLRFEITKERISIRLTAPYSQERRDAASNLAKKTNTFKNAQ